MAFPRHNPHSAGFEADNRQKVQLLVKEALGGSFSSQMALVDYIKATSTYDASVSRAFIMFLHPRLIPKSPSITQHCVMNAAGAMAIISAQCHAIVLGNVDRGAMVDLLLAHTFHFVRWFYFLKGKEKFTITSAAFLYMMTCLDDRLADAIMASQPAVDLAIGLWKHRDSQGRYLLHGDENIQCPMLLLLTDILHRDVGRSTIFELLYTYPAKASHIAQTIRGRIGELGCRHLEGGISMTCALRNIHELVQFMKTLIHEAGNYPYLLERLHSPQLFFVIFQSLDTILRTDGSSVMDTTILDIYHFAFELLLAIGDGFSNPVAKIKSALEGGFLRVSFYLLLHIPTANSGYMSILDCVANIGTHVPYKAVAVSFSDAMSALDPAHAAQLSKISTRFAQCWAAIGAERIRSMHGELDQEAHGTTRRLCHCIEHSDVYEGSSQKFGIPRKCAKCHAVAYCSSACQRADWRSRHREECHSIEMQGAIPNTSLSSPRLPFRLQADLAFYIQRVMQSHFATPEHLCRYDELTPKSHPPIFVVDCTYTPPVLSIAPPTTFEGRRYYGAERRISHHLARNVAGTGNLIVDAFFPWGLLAVNVLIALQRDGEGRVQAVGATVLGFLTREHGTSSFPRHDAGEVGLPAGFAEDSV